MRMRLGVMLALIVAGSASAGTPERDKDWNGLIAEARKHGGAATEYKDSISYVFTTKDGSFVTLTSLNDKRARAVCLLSRELTMQVCGNWDTGKLQYAWRANAASQWTFSDTPPKPVEADQNPIQKFVGLFMETVGSTHFSTK